jgi:hypothetical protein
MVPCLVQTGTTETETEIMNVTKTATVVIQKGTGMTETAQDHPGGILTATTGTETGTATGVAIEVFQVSEGRKEEGLLAEERQRCRDGGQREGQGQEEKRHAAPTLRLCLEGIDGP